MLIFCQSALAVTPPKDRLPFANYEITEHLDSKVCDTRHGYCFALSTLTMAFGNHADFKPPPTTPPASEEEAKDILRRILSETSAKNPGRISVPGISSTSDLSKVEPYRSVIGEVLFDLQSRQKDISKVQIDPHSKQYLSSDTSRYSNPKFIKAENKATCKRLLSLEKQSPGTRNQLAMFYKSPTGRLISHEIVGMGTHEVGDGCKISVYDSNEPSKNYSFKINHQGEVVSYNFPYLPGENPDLSTLMIQSDKVSYTLPDPKGGYLEAPELNGKEIEESRHSK